MQQKQNNRKVGSAYERLASDYLKEQGYQILSRNYRTRFGELDLVALDQGTLVFIEVKYRKNDRAGTPLESITPYKQLKLKRMALTYLGLNHYPMDTPCRFDIVSVTGTHILLLQDAFT